MIDFSARLVGVAAKHKTIMSQITLQKLLPSHAAELFILIDHNSEYLKQWLGWVDKVREVQDSSNFIKQVNDQIEQNKSLTFGIFFTNKLVGVIGFNKIDWQNKQANIGYWLAANYQGRGIITMACQTLLDIGFAELNLTSININCAIGNLKSQAIPIRLGFTKKELLKDHELLNGRRVDHIIYSKQQNC